MTPDAVFIVRYGMGYQNCTEKNGLIPPFQAHMHTYANARGTCADMHRHP